MSSIKEKYRRFLNTTDGARIYNEFKRILYTDEDSLVQTLDNDLLQDLPLVRQNCLNICDIGGGDGKRIIHILRYLHGKFHIRFQLDFVEQSQPYIKAFDSTPVNDFTTSSVFHALFEDVSLPGNYDLIFLIHSIFAFQPGTSMEKVLSLTKQGGKTIIVSNSPTSFLAGLKYLIDEGYDDQRYEIDRVCDELNTRGINYRNVTFQTRWAIDNERYDVEISTILKWLSLGEFDSFNTEKKRLIFNYIAENSIQSNERRFFSEDEIILVVPASTEPDL